MFASSTLAPSAQVTRKGEGEVFTSPFERFRCLLTAAQTAGTFSLFEITVQPGGNAPMHVHLEEDETFVVLEGRIAAYVDGKRVEAGPGDTVHFPPGTPHAFRAISQVPARAILLLHPGGTEAFYRRMCELVNNRADIEAFNRLSMEHKIEVTGPCPE